MNALHLALRVRIGCILLAISFRRNYLAGVTSRSTVFHMGASQERLLTLAEKGVANVQADMGRASMHSDLRGLSMDVRRGMATLARAWRLACARRPFAC